MIRYPNLNVGKVLVVHAWVESGLSSKKRVNEGITARFTPVNKCIHGEVLTSRHCKPDINVNISRVYDSRLKA